MADDKFAADVDDWVERTLADQTNVLHESLRLLDDTVADVTPVVTGNLRNSRALSTLGAPTVDFRRKSKYSDPSDAINNAIAGVEVGQPAWLGFRAPYAHIVDRKHAFFRLAAQRWEQIVDTAARTVRGRG